MHENKKIRTEHELHTFKGNMYVYKHTFFCMWPKYPGHGMWVGNTEQKLHDKRVIICLQTRLENIPN